MRKKSTISFVLFFWGFILQSIYANNLQIVNVALTNDSTISFHVSWENSWRVSVAPNNHDAVWIFIKYKDCASGQWAHANLSATVGHHTTGAPLEVYIDGKDGGSNAKGLFLRRSAAGVGNVTSTLVSLRMAALPVGQYDFRVFGVEMVQIPQGSFRVGDGDVSTGSFVDGSGTGPFLVTSEAAIGIAASAGNLYTTSATYRPVALPAAYPKGFSEIYCMKHEITQGQYVDFVNLLLSDQGAALQITGVANRLNITGTWPVLLANTPHRAMNFLGWADLLAYLDWAALRPMTELEYEKISRGPAIPVGGEYAWGTALITDANTLINDGTASEAATNAIPAGSGLTNFNNTTVLGPVRCGFAAQAATSRTEAGAGYYGVMELSGNLWEATVSTRNVTGTAFTGNVGDGVISITPTPGFANQASWPSVQASVASTVAAVGRAQRGGSWADASTLLRTAERTNVNLAEGRRLSTFGGRGVR